jgi:hypothetical protein
MNERRNTGTRSIKGAPEEGHIVAIPNPVTMLAAQKNKDVVQFIMEGRPVQFRAKKKQNIALVCFRTDSFLE